MKELLAVCESERVGKESKKDMKELAVIKDLLRRKGKKDRLGERKKVKNNRHPFFLL